MNLDPELEHYFRLHEFRSRFGEADSSCKNLDPELEWCFKLGELEPEMEG